MFRFFIRLPSAGFAHKFTELLQLPAEKKQVPVCVAVFAVPVIQPVVTFTVSHSPLPDFSLLYPMHDQNKTPKFTGRSFFRIYRTYPRAIKRFHG